MTSAPGYNDSDHNRAGNGPKNRTPAGLDELIKSKEKAAHKEAAKEILEDGQRTEKLR